ncbi:hypothetical protein KFL_000590060 [Klebsormidium nitens]|uniref:SRCR domain-containing protein n=1 Tax=Klebsormidium nitens TaxID=105231 RepID=A0A1Y1HPU3_KLENI|nr:hypothetical protein KFL_000590060 [Klebsormidium nitens]|eukprot:GAQ80654.1 hypothetical protein KFL_000590060 [Klebsormidium nitens]
MAPSPSNAARQSVRLPQPLLAALLIYLTLSHVSSASAAVDEWDGTDDKLDDYAQFMDLDSQITYNAHGHPGMVLEDEEEQSEVGGRHRYNAMHIVDGKGSLLHIKYDVRTVANLVNLANHADVISGVRCFRNELHVSVIDGAPLPTWPTGATLVGGLEWNCTDEEGEPAPFYRRLLRVLPDNESSDVIMETHHREMVHCFRGAKISFKYTPCKGSPDSPGDDLRHARRKLLQFGFVKTLVKTAGQVVDAGVSGVKKMGQAVVIAADVVGNLAINGRFDWHGGQNWDLFQFNYDKATQRAVLQNDVLYAKTATQSNGFNTKESARVTCVNCYATLEAGVSVDIVLKRQQLEQAHRPEPRVQHAHHNGSPVPLVILPSIQLYARANLAAAVRGGATFGVDYQQRLQFGQEFREAWGEFRPVQPEAFARLNLHPPTLSFQGEAMIEGLLILEVTLKLYDAIPVVIAPAPYLGVEFATSLTRIQKSCPISYRIYSGLNLSLGLDKLEIPLGKVKVNVGGSIIPFRKSLRLIGKSYLPCAYCSGCIHTLGSDPLYKWVAGPWGTCGADSVWKRDVTCQADGQPNFAMADALCKDAGAKPPASSACSVAPSCPATCQPADGVCNAECNVAACGHDAGDCRTSDPCRAFSDCRTCLTGPAVCGWCASAGACIQSEAACARDFWTDRCAPEETQIAFSRPSYADTLRAGQSFAVRWSGGPASGKVVLRYRFDDSPDVFSGFGIPAEGVPNSGTFTKSCGGGVRTRTTFCANAGNGTAVDASFCYAAAKPAAPPLSCNTQACVQCPNVPICLPGSGYQCTTCSCLPNGDGTEFCGMYYTDVRTGARTRTGCDTRGNEYQECCRKQGLYCEDKCTEKAQWVVEFSMECSKPCGGGDQYRQFQCRGWLMRKGIRQEEYCEDAFCGRRPPGSGSSATPSRA